MIVIKSRRRILLVCLLVILVQTGCDTTTSKISTISESFVLNQDTIWFILKTGELRKLSVNGNQKIVPATDVVSRKVFFLNEQEGWVLDDTGRCWATADGGQNWDLRGSLQSNLISISDTLVFVNNKIGWLSFASGILFANGGGVFRTEDGGRTWRNISLPKTIGDAKVESPRSLSVIDSDSAYIGTGAGWILSTDNQGSSWETARLPVNVEVTSISVLGEQAIFASTLGGLYYSEKPYKTWQTVSYYHGKSNVRPASVSFISPTIGWIAGIESGKNIDNVESLGVLLFKTTDKGNTWIQQDHNLEKIDDVQVLRFLDNQYGWLISDDIIYQTRDGGETWSQRFSARNPESSGT